MVRLILGALALLAGSLARGDSLTFSIYTLKGEERELLAADRRDYTVDDIKVVPRGNEGDCRGCSLRSLPLSDGFSVGVYVVPDLLYQDRMSGFGMWVERDGDTDGFSWAWFVHEKDLVFHMGERGGRIRVKLEPFENLFRLASIEFLDDIEIHYQEDIRGREPGQRSHAVVVSRGSVLTLSR